VWEFGEESMKKWISRLAHDCRPTKQVTWEANAGSWRVHDMLDFTSYSRLRPSREWPIKLTAWLLFECDFSHSLPTLYKPSLPMICKKKEYLFKKLLREKTLTKHLRVRDCLPTILYIISLKYPFTPISPFTHPWEVLTSNTYLNWKLKMCENIRTRLDPQFKLRLGCFYTNLIVSAE